jgi:hypothetical protein
LKKRKKKKERKPEWETAVKQGNERDGRAEERLDYRKQREIRLLDCCERERVKTFRYLNS